tara:strand:+ start:510 stop:1070 length:561 start_codon:yes stop_codon:yes gene_type:complete
MALTTVRSTGIGSLPAISGANLTSLTAGNLTGTLPAISGANLTGIAGGGKLLQVVQHHFTTEQGFNNSGYEASFITGAITPSATSSKVFIMVETVSTNNDTQSSYGKCKIYRGTTGLSATVHFDRIHNSPNAGYYRHMPISTNYLDSPNTTSATTYTLYRLKYNGGLGYLGINNTQSTLTLMEIGA